MKNTKKNVLLFFVGFGGGSGLSVKIPNSKWFLFSLHVLPGVKSKKFLCSLICKSPR